MEGPKMRFAMLKVAVLACIAVGIVAANGFAGDKPIKGIEDVKGTWVGTVTGPQTGPDKVILQIAADGTYSADSWSMMAGGKGKLVNGKILWQGMNATGTAVLSEDDELVVSTNDGSAYAVLNRKK
jgi:hypothetical protein